MAISLRPGKEDIQDSLLIRSPWFQIAMFRYFASAIEHPLNVFELEHRLVKKRMLCHANLLSDHPN